MNWAGLIVAIFGALLIYLAVTNRYGATWAYVSGQRTKKA